MPTFLEEVPTDRIQIIAVLGSIFLLAFLFYLIKISKIKEKYSILWIIFGIIILILSIWRELLNFISFNIGIAYPPAALFLFLVIFGFSLFLHFSIVISRQSEKIRKLIQKIALLEKVLQDMNKKNDYKHDK